MNFEECYGPQIDNVLKDSPVLSIGNALFGKYNNKMDTPYFLHMYMKLIEQWESFKIHNVSILIELNDILEYKANFDLKKLFEGYIKEALKSPYKSVKLNCVMNGSGFEVKNENYDLDKVGGKDATVQSYKSKTIILLFSEKGIDAFGDGVPLLKSNESNVYNLISGKKWLSIEYYKELLKEFYEDHIKNDRMERYLLKNTTCPKEWKGKVKDDPNILINKPEKKFQIDFSLYLRNNCSDTILKETYNDDGDRYDIWVTNTEQEVYIFEIKWLGKSITETGNFTVYNGDRAIEGAWQLYHYLTEANERGRKNPSNAIRQGILLIFDARSEDTEILYPEELVSTINLDLDNCFKLQPKPFPASSAHKHYAKGS